MHRNEIKSSGNHFPCRKLINYCANTISPIMERMIKECHETGKIPEDWKTADVTPIPKAPLVKDPDKFKTERN